MQYNTGPDPYNDWKVSYCQYQILDSRFRMCFNGLRRTKEKVLKSRRRKHSPEEKEM